LRSNQVELPNVSWELQASVRENDACVCRFSHPASEEEPYG
jgi:hypothetical protein